jgi:TonB family protein
MSNSDAQFLKDDELHNLLDRWNPPDPSQSLDNRVAAAYNQIMEDAAARPNPALQPQRGSEVVTMKFCSTCHEEFADRFSFCPVDGSPLSIVAASETATPAPQEIETSYPISESVGSAFVKSPLITLSLGGVAPSTRNYRAAAPGTHAEMIGEFHLTILEDRGLISRLASELSGVAEDYRLTWPEFKRDPFGFVGRSIRGYGQMIGRFFGSRDVTIAMLISFVGLAALIGGIMLLDRTQSAKVSRTSEIIFGGLAFAALIAVFATWLSRDRGAAVMGARPSDSRDVLSGIVAAFVIVFGSVGAYLGYQFLHQRAAAAAAAQEEELIVQNMIEIPNEQPTPDEGTAGMAKGSGGGSKPKQEKAGGGGGGGREEQTPASFGKLPQADLRIPQVVAPDPHPPVIKNPALPMPATLDADPALFPPDTRNLSYGDPKSKSMTPSSGPGTGNGIGSGTGGGVGPGSGGGYGPGTGGNTGGGSRNEGGGGPGGGGGGTDYNRVFSGKDVNQKARILEKPEPTYTEEARKNQITGTVVLKVVFAASGQVTNIHMVSGLPDGLNERAIAAAKRIRFVPAMKDGRPVSMYFQLEYNFNLY